VGITAALLVLERLLLVISERALLRPVLVRLQPCHLSCSLALCWVIRRRSAMPRLPHKGHVTAQVALLAGGQADIMAPSAANMPAWASAGALLRAQDSQSQDYGRQLADGASEEDEVRRQPASSVQSQRCQCIEQASMCLLVKQLAGDITADL
jgi:hypothetical protein